MSQCQASTIESIAALISSGKYSWCNINDDLQRLQGWLDDQVSWGGFQWFTTTVWNNRINEGPYLIFNTQQLLFIIVSLLANIYILFYHYTEPVHPKYTISFYRRMTIRIHVLSGSIGVILPLYTFFTTNIFAGYVCMFIFVIWDIIFNFSSIIQAPYVYGVRSVTVPLYFVCIFCKLVLSACLLSSLLIEPLGGYKSQVQWLWMCWVIHQTYAWVRIWYVTFFMADAMLDHQYTISVFLAGAMCVGAVMGFYLWVLWVIAMVCNYAYIYYNVEELRKEEFNSGKLRRLSLKKGPLSVEEEKDMSKARELSLLWNESTANCWRKYPEAAKNAIFSLRDMLAQQDIVIDEHEDDEDMFYYQAKYKTPNSIKAKLLFEFIRGENEFISEEDLTHFLIAFGVSHGDARQFFNEMDLTKKKYLGLEDFEKRLSAFYTYAFDGLLDWTILANRKSNKNYLDDVVFQEQQHKCPFRRGTKRLSLQSSMRNIMRSSTAERSSTRSKRYSRSSMDHNDISDAAYSRANTVVEFHQGPDDYINFSEDVEHDFKMDV